MLGHPPLPRCPRSPFRLVQPRACDKLLRQRASTKEQIAGAAGSRVCRERGPTCPALGSRGACCLTARATPRFGSEGRSTPRTNPPRRLWRGRSEEPFQLHSWRPTWSSVDQDGGVGRLVPLLVNCRRG